MRLGDRMAIVTGAGSGMGRAIALEFGTAGGRVACLDLNGPAALATAERLGPGRGVAIPCDVADGASVTAAVARATAEFGAAEILANCAGVHDGFAPLGKTPDELWDRVMNVNLRGMFLMTRAVLPAMLAGGRGAIVNIASVAGLVGRAGGAAYTASKHGVIGLTRQTACDYGRKGIRANAICPGAVETAMTRDILDPANTAGLALIRATPSGRHGQPREVARIALCLVSDDGSFVQGAAIPVDGGWTAR